MKTSASKIIIRLCKAVDTYSTTVCGGSKMLKKLIAVIITATVAFSLLASTAIAGEETGTTSVNAELTNVYGGRGGIISMTFDDGYYQTALLLQEFFEKYDLYGSLMMVSGSANGQAPTYASTEEWNALFDKGRLEPQNHSATHTNLGADGDPAYQNVDFFKTELLDSKTKLEEYFPEYDILSYAMPYGRMSDASLAYASEHYFAIRTAGTVKVQTLNPSTSLDEAGSWYRMNSPATKSSQYINDPEKHWEWLKALIDKSLNSWFLPITHKVGDVEGADLSYEVADKMFKYIHELDEAGKVWVTTYGNAIKYVRERQNSTVKAWKKNGEIFVRVTMAEYTEDGKYLDPTVFDHPLTVKLEVPDNYGTVYYTVGGEEFIATSFSEGTSTFVYLNVIPDGSDVKVRLGNSHSYSEWEKNDGETHKRTCLDCGAVNYGDHNLGEGEVVLEATCTTEGSEICECTDCGESVERVIPENDNHDFSNENDSALYRAEKANCRHGTLYYYTCTRCMAKGVETFEVGESEEHDFGKWKVIEEATEDKDGYKERLCKNDGCDETERLVLPKIGNGDKANNEKDKNGFVLPLILGIGGAAVIAGAVAAVTIIKKKKPNK